MNGPVAVRLCRDAAQPAKCRSRESPLCEAGPAKGMGRMKTILPGFLLALTSFHAAVAQTPPAVALRSAESFAAITDSRARAAALFQEAGKVLQHPRCVNCHPRTDRPLQGDGMQLHQPLVVRGKDGHGAVAMSCQTCHGAANFAATANVTVPGNPKWALAPLAMAWEGRSLRQICQQIKDPKRNGGKSMAQLVDHMAHDSLVGWGWDPGAGRTPAPGTQRQLGELIQAWVDAGANCPS